MSSNNWSDTSSVFTCTAKSAKKKRGAKAKRGRKFFSAPGATVQVMQSQVAVASNEDFSTSQESYNNGHSVETNGSSDKHSLDYPNIFDSVVDGNEKRPKPGPKSKKLKRVQETIQVVNEIIEPAEAQVPEVFLQNQEPEPEPEPEPEAVVNVIGNELNRSLQEEFVEQTTAESEPVVEAEETASQIIHETCDVNLQLQEEEAEVQETAVETLETTQESVAEIQVELSPSVVLMNQSESQEVEDEESTSSADTLEYEPSTSVKSPMRELPRMAYVPLAFGRRALHSEAPAQLEQSTSYLQFFRPTVSVEASKRKAVDSVERDCKRTKSEGFFSRISTPVLERLRGRGRAVAEAAEEEGIDEGIVLDAGDLSGVGPDDVVGKEELPAEVIEPAKKWCILM